MKISRNRLTGWAGFSKWLQSNHPAIYRDVKYRLANEVQLSGLGFAIPTVDPIAAVDQKPGIASSIVNTLKDVIAVALPVYQQQKIFELNVKRAQAGQTMLDAGDISSVKVGVDNSTQRTLLYVAGGLALAYFLPKLLRR